MFSTTMEPYIGHLAGIATAMLWTVTSLLFTAAARRIGTTVLNASRIAFGIILLALTHRMLSGQWVPDALAGQITYLAWSGIIGLTIGDQALFTAFLDIGPRISTLVMTTSPIFAAFFGWVVLGETLGVTSLVGITLTVMGVAWVVVERPRVRDSIPRSLLVRGVVLALIGAACQGGGLMLSKQGMGHGWLPADQHLNPQAATLVRAVFAGLGMIPLVALRWFRRRSRPVLLLDQLARRRQTVGYLLAIAGSVVGPFLGVWMSLVASDRAPVGIAQTLCSMTPLFIIPAVAIIHREHISRRSILGAVIAIGGSSLLFVDAG